MSTGMDAALNHPIIFLIACLVACVLCTTLVSKPKLPAGVPWVGKQENVYFAESRAILTGLTTWQERVSEGYHKYLKKGKSYVAPGFGGRTSIVLPRSQAAWLLSQPDKILSASEFHYDVLEGSYAFTDPTILKDPYHEHVTHKLLPRRLNQIALELQEEVAHTVDQNWGFDTEWKDVVVLDSLMTLIASLTHRMLVGLPLCRNRDYLKNMKSFANDVIATTLVMSFVPHWCRPILGAVISLPNKLHWRRTTKYTHPLITDLLKKIQRKRQDPSFEWEEPNNYLSWHINLALDENRLDELTVDRISRRILPMDFAAIHTTTLAATNAVFDLISADPQYLQQIREEIQQVYAEEGYAWTKAGLGKLVRTDSAIRESMRLSIFLAINATRKVIVKDGITNPFEGWHAPEGTYIGLDMEGVQHDADIYPDPLSYRAFRFVQSDDKPKMTEGSTNGAGGKGLEPPYLKKADLINTSDIFLPFSHGRHACPGRFFVALEVKSLFAYIVMNYEIEHLQTRPKNSWIGPNPIPPTKATIRVRRRKGTFGP